MRRSKEHHAKNALQEVPAGIKLQRHVDEELFEDDPTEAVAHKDEGSLLLKMVSTLQPQSRRQIEGKVVGRRAGAAEEDGGVVAKGHDPGRGDAPRQRVSQPDVVVFRASPRLDWVSAEAMDGDYAARVSTALGIGDPGA